MNILVGYTGFVGSNINASFKFDKVFNSKNISEAYGLNPDLCVYSGVRAEKYIANNFPEEDLKTIYGAIDNIKKINPKTIVLISTIDVLDAPYGDEDSNNYSPLPYGKNRKVLEDYVEANFENYLIVRLPGLYGMNLKKNFIYDYLHPVPGLLNQNKYVELSAKNPKISEYYRKNDRNFFEIKSPELLDTRELKNIFNELGFSALNFTDSRGLFQFYNLAFLWHHITKCLENKIKLIHIATEPLSIGDIYTKLENKPFKNEVAKIVPSYNMKTKYWELFGSTKDYIFNKKFVLNDIYKFIKKPEPKLSASNMVIPNDSFNESISLMIKYGFNGLEILPTKLLNASLPDCNSDAINKIVSNQLPIVSMQSILFGNSLNLFNVNEIDQLIKDVKNVIDLAEQLSCPNLVFGCPKNRNKPNGADMNLAYRFFKEIGDYAYAHKTIIALEPNPTIYNTNFLNTTKEAIEFVQKVNSKGLKINLDLGAVIYNNENLDYCFKHVDLINHIHISEPYLKPISLRDVHYKLFEKVIEHDYKNYISLELKEGDFNFEELLSSVSVLANRI